MYAQAVTLIRQGERYWFDDEEEALIKKSNMAFERELDVEHVLRDLIRKPESEGEGQFMAVTEILELVKSHPCYNRKTMDNLWKLGRALTKMGLEKTRRGGGCKYAVVKI